MKDKLKSFPALLLTMIFCACSGEKLPESEASAAEPTEQTSFSESSERLYETEQTTASETSAEQPPEEDTMLKRAVSQAENGDKLYGYGHRLIFTDLDMDDFPEIIALNDDHLAYIGKYCDETGWQQAAWGYSEINDCLRLYYDKENDSFFFISIGAGFGNDIYFYSEYITYDETGKEYSEFYGNNSIQYPMGEYSKGSFELFWGGGAFRIAEYPAEKGDSLRSRFGEFRELTEDSLSGYELVKCYEFGELFSRFNERFPRTEKGTQAFFDGDFSDFLTDKGLRYSAAPETLFTVGKNECNRFTQSVVLESGDICPESFEKLSQLPMLTSLYLSSENVDLTGIEKLAGLKVLDIDAESVSGADGLSELPIEWLYVCADNIDFAENMPRLKVFEAVNAADRDEDYFAPLYGNESLKYILVSVWDNTAMSAEQSEHIGAHRPDILLCRFKVG